MDTRRFDRLARQLATSGTRRQLLGGLITLPLLREATAPEPATAERRKARQVRRDRKQRQPHAEHWGKRKAHYCLDGRTIRALRRKQDTLLSQSATVGRCCAAEAASATCAGQCGGIPNNCGAPVDCGDCACVPEPKETTCAGKCHEVANNCGTPVDCGVCPCVPACDQCATCEDGVCTPIGELNHACGICPTGQWCDAGACASIADTATIPECGGLCNDGTQSTYEICGQDILCPSCYDCAIQTGCYGTAEIPDGPSGAGLYCASTSWAPAYVYCESAPCPADSYCVQLGSKLCMKICPY
ncbi:MAG: hypothetical protein QM692_14020 [Thermomicrobiales bacterium]